MCVHDGGKKKVILGKFLRLSLKKEKRKLKQKCALISPVSHVNIPESQNSRKSARIDFSETIKKLQ